MLRRVVKDHSDIKKSPMMQTEISVCHLKENTIVRSRCVIRVVFPGMSATLSHGAQPLAGLMTRIECLQIDKVILSF